MSNTRRFVPVLMLIVLVAISAVLANTLAAENQLLSFIAVFLLGTPLLLLILGAGIRRVERNTFVVRKDALGGIDTFEDGVYLYIPYLHTIEAMMPNYALRHEFSADLIDTRALNLKQIKSIRVRVVYRLVAKRFCSWLYPALFTLSRQKQQARGAVTTDEGEPVDSGPYAFIKRQIAHFDETEKLKPDNPELWIRILSKVLEYVLDDMIRDWIWNWQDHVDADAQLQLSASFTNPPKGENDPYAINLNRRALAAKIRADLDSRTQKWGLRVHDIVFENIMIDEEIVKFKTRNKERELENARHDALKEAVAIREKGFAEADVRAETVAQIIAKLAGERAITLSDELICNIVRAAMYSDGEMIWHATMERGPGSNASVKVA
jgi:hypothetical protein